MMPSNRFIMALFFLVFSSSITGGAAKLLNAPAQSVDSVDWEKMARSLTGESDTVRKKALKNLRRIEGLDQILAREVREPVLQNGKFNTRRFLALDVITALDRKALLPVLISTSLLDPTGYSYHTINTLITEKDIESMARLYRDRLLRYPSAPAVKLALLDTLGRMGVELSLAEIRYLKSDAPVEVQSGILSYMRELMIWRNRLHYQLVVPEFMMADSFDLKMQTLYLMEELVKKKKINLREAGLRCDQEQEKSILNFCKKLAGTFS